MAAKRKTNRNSFGSTRRLPSGRWQARYPDPDGQPMTAPRTFDTKADAEAHISQVRADRSRGTYLDPRKGERVLRDFAADWIENGGSRGALAPRTRALYLDLFNRHIDGPLGGKALLSVTPEVVRSWRTGLRKELIARAMTKKVDGSKRIATGEARTRQAYALLRSIMATAESDGLIGKNPCNIPRAGVAKAPERPLLSMAQFSALVEAHPAHVRPALHLAMGAHLRLGELIGLRRGDLDLTAGTLTIARQVVADGTEPTPTKTGTTRTIDLPSVTVELMADYLAGQKKALPGAPLFARADGRGFTRSMVTQAWRKARSTVGLPAFHFHDIRHAGLTFSAQTGATMAELMKRAGHTTTAAAAVYQHAAAERGRIVAAGLDTALRRVGE